MSLWSIIPAAVGLGITALNKPKKKDYTPNMDYMDRYINSLRGRKQTNETYNLAMRPVLRSIGAQAGRTSRSMEYGLEKSGMAGSGAALQGHLSIQQQATEGIVKASDKASALQTQENQRINERIGTATLQKEQMESQAHQAWDRATSQWKTKMWGAGASLGVAGAGAGAEAVQSAKAVGQAYNVAIEDELFDGTEKEFRQKVKDMGAEPFTELLMKDKQTKDITEVGRMFGFNDEEIEVLGGLNPNAQRLMINAFKYNEQEATRQEQYDTQQKQYKARIKAIEDANEKNLGIGVQNDAAEAANEAAKQKSKNEIEALETLQEIDKEKTDFDKKEIDIDRGTEKHESETREFNAERIAELDQKSEDIEDYYNNYTGDMTLDEYQVALDKYRTEQESIQGARSAINLVLPAYSSDIQEIAQKMLQDPTLTLKELRQLLYQIKAGK